MKQLRLPGTFCVGDNILEKITSYIADYGKNIIFIGGEKSLNATSEQLGKGFKGSDCTCGFVVCGRIVSKVEIERIKGLPEVEQAEVLCAVGGGSCMDITRTVANEQKKPLIMIPTTVASDAPCSFVSVYYSEDGSEVVGDKLFHKCPDMVIVDSQIISNAPARHLASGMGDAIATYYESTTCYNNPEGKKITLTAMSFGKLCKEVILRDGLDAYHAVENKIVIPQLEKVIEVNCLLSGAGGANTGCAAAHGIGDYLCVLPSGHQYMHGERVYVGLMIQLILEQYPQNELLELMKFGRSVGLPICLTDIGVEEVAEVAEKLAKGLQGDHFMENLSCDHSETMVAGAFVYAQLLADNL